MNAAASSPMSLWWKLEPRVDLWASAGALALAVGAVLFVLL